MSSSASAILTQAEFFTTTHRLTGQVQTGPKRLGDVLNDQSQSYLLIFNVYTSRLKEPGGISGHAPEAYLAKENLSFVLVSSRETRPPDVGRFTVHEYKALAFVPGFELRGTFAGPHRIDLRNFSPAALDPFITLTDVSAQLVARPEITFAGEAALVNRRRLESLCLTE